MRSVACYDCERDVSRRHIATVEVAVHHDEGMGYDMVPVPLCRDCRLRRSGYQCDHCGEYHPDIESVDQCCRGESKAPRCPECSRTMDAGAWGTDVAGNPSIDWAECEACGIGWGAFTGYHDLDQEPAEDGGAA